MLPRLNAAAELVPEARAFLDAGQQAEALAAFKATYNLYAVDVIAANRAMGHVLNRIEKNREAGNPANQKLSDELAELKLEHEAAVLALPPEAATIAHAIFALDLFEV